MSKAKRKAKSVGYIIVLAIVGYIIIRSGIVGLSGNAPISLHFDKGSTSIELGIIIRSVGIISFSIGHYWQTQ